MSTTSGNTNLVNTEDNTKVIETLPTLAGGYTDSTFIVNKWGYKKNRNTDNYNSFPATQTLLENDERTNEDIANLRFGTKIDYLQESGTYATNIEFNLVANPLIYYMQDLNPALCTTTPMTVVDKRDNQEYVIQRLADGNCWMMTNLNLGATTLTTDLTSANTNLSTTVTAATFNGWKKSSGTGTYIAGEYILVSGTDSTSQTPYGTLYNYCATSAGTYCYPNSQTTPASATYDICPKGWRLPTGGTSGEFQSLYDRSEYNSVAKMRAPIADSGAAFALSGRFSSGGVQLNGTGGFYWSSTKGTDEYMYDLRLNTTVVQAAFSPDSIRRNYGRSIRCVLKDPRTISDITTMQEINSQIVANTAEGSTATLKDSRDNNTYTVAKIKGNVWLLENLRLDISDPAVQANLTSATTNATNTTLGYLKNGGGSSPYPVSGVIAKTASGGSWADDYANPYIATQYKNTTQAASGSSPAGKIGIYYNYCAASAGSYCYAGGAGTGDASQDICPSGWRMPTSGASGEYQALYTAYSSNVANFQSALSTPLSGYFYSGTAGNQGTSGYFWSSTRYDGNSVYNLRVYSSAVSPQSYSVRSLGFSVRCIAK